MEDEIGEAQVFVPESETTKCARVPSSCSRVP